MAITRNRNGNGTGTVHATDPHVEEGVSITEEEDRDYNEEEETHEPSMLEMIASEVDKSLRDILPGVVQELKKEILAALGKDTESNKETEVNSKVVSEDAEDVKGKGPRQRPESFNYKDFAACQPPQFHGEVNPVISNAWIDDVEGAFCIGSIAEECKIMFASNLMRGAAKTWWLQYAKKHTKEQMKTKKWEDFKADFVKNFVPDVEQTRLATEFLNFEQTTETIAELNQKFFELSAFCPEYVAT